MPSLKVRVPTMKQLYNYVCDLCSYDIVLDIKLYCFGACMMDWVCINFGGLVELV